ncbi:MAG: ShlB/FhaC/HecB family hemolysin secretion/activation protein [Phycisphaerae bacterium]
MKTPSREYQALSDHSCVGRGPLARAASLLVVLAGMAAPLHAAEPPFDINAPRPVGPRSSPRQAPPPRPSSPEAATGADRRESPSGSASAPGRTVPADGRVYAVSRVIIEWRTPGEGQPSADELLDTQVTLGVLPQGYVSSRELSPAGQPLTDVMGRPLARSGVPTETFRLRDLGVGVGAQLHASAIGEVCRGVALELNRRGFISVFVRPAEDQISMKSGEDLRQGATGDLRLVVWTGRVSEVRTVASGERLSKEIEAGTTPAVNTPDRVHERIRAQSPVAANDLVRRDLIDDHLARLNRHPGRRVEAAVAPGAGPDEVTLDYLVAENKPWTAYAELSNTGTKSTSEWRERFGFVHNQLTRRDDVLRLDYVTAGFDRSHAVNVDYSFPVLSDRVRARGFGSWSQYDASDVGFAGETFRGENAAAGADIVATVWQRRDFFLDVVAGLKWQSIDVENSVLAQKGSDNFMTPSVGLAAERVRDASALHAAATVSWNVDDLDKTEKDALGRPGVDQSFTVLRMEAGHSFYLEPVLNDLGWFNGPDGKGFTSLAHELSLSGRGQFSFDNRLIPTEEEVAGGFFSVRGYPESLAAGDNVFIGSLEYRFHLPNALSPGRPGTMGDAAMPAWVGRDFRWTPQHDFGRADWDLVLKGFFDIASVNQSEKLAGELPDTLISAGAGVDLLFRRNVSARIDWGLALKDAGPEQLGSSEREVSAGSSRLHFLLTVSY